MIDYVIISSDDNPIYKDFYPIVSEAWNHIGIKTYYINITDENGFFENDMGVVHKIKKIENISSSFQSQVVRIFAANLIADKNILTSDIDMLPINGDYFIENSNDLSGNVISYSRYSPSNTPPHYPMCYILGNTNTLKEILGIDRLSFADYCNLLLEKYGENWNTDEMFIHDKFVIQKERIVIKNRGTSDRIDRSRWGYDINRLKSKYYIDAHLLRPLSENRGEILKLAELSKL